MIQGTCINCGRVISKGLDEADWADMGNNIICDANLNQGHINDSDSPLSPDEMDHVAMIGGVIYQAQGESPCEQCREMIHTGDLVIYDEVTQKLYCTRECFDQVPHDVGT